METVDCIVGAGVTGGAVACERALCSIAIVVAADAIDTETSSRNFEAIYCPKRRMTAALWVKGRDRLYAHAAERRIAQITATPGPHLTGPAITTETAT